MGPQNRCYDTALLFLHLLREAVPLPESSYGSGSVVNFPDEVWNKIPAANDFGAR